MIACLHDSGSNFVGIPLAISSGDQWRLFSTSDSVAQTVSTAVWYTVVVRKATGTVTPRFSVYNHGTGTWSHQNGSSSQANWTAPGASGTTRFNFQGTSDRFNGRIAVRAAWSNAVHWTADASGDTAIEAAGLEDSLQNWIDEIPDALWAFNQASVATPVDDLSTGGTADQTAITGTTVITTDAPPGFSFTLGAPAVPNLFVTRSNLSLR